MVSEKSCLSCGSAVAFDARECLRCGSAMPEQEQTGQMFSPAAAEERTGQVELPLTLMTHGADGQEQTGSVASPMAVAFAQATALNENAAAIESPEHAHERTGQMFSAAAAELAAQQNDVAVGQVLNAFDHAALAELAASAATPLPSNAPGPEILPPLNEPAPPREGEKTSPELKPVPAEPLPGDAVSESAGALGSAEETAPTQSHAPVSAPHFSPSTKKDPLVGTHIGDYWVEGRVGIGAMGVVYRGFNAVIAKHVAIKVLRNDIVANPRDMERLLEEARVVNAIQHRNIISIFGAGELSDGRQYLVMEYLEGETLDARLERETKLSVRDALPILQGVLAALDAAHKVGIVHRDLKPANVFLAKQADGESWVKLLDFGLARKEEKREVSRIAGTPDYIAPEHARGKAPTPASDLYGFGVLAFHVLTGRLPFIGSMPIEVMDQHVHNVPPSPREFEPTLPQAMVDLVLWLLQKDPERRPKVKEIRHILRQAGSDQEVTLADESPHAPSAITAPRRSAPQPGVPTLRDSEATLSGVGGGTRSGMPLSWALLSLLLLGVGLVGGWLLAQNKQRAEAPALDAAAADEVWQQQTEARLEKLKGRLVDANGKSAFKAVQRKVELAKTVAQQKDADRALIELENRVLGK
ncbi:MAG: protein kinase [Myxococcaceae bacterium]|nr:protein kinase [Myxococcaceae bacterium]